MLSNRTQAFLCSLLVLSFFFTNCATIFKGGHAEVRFNSSPAGADIIVDQVNMGETPAAIQLSRSESHTVTFTKDGYEDVTVRVNKKFDAATAVVGNIFSWALLGIVVDVASGAAYTLSPADVEANFDKLANAGVINPEEIPAQEDNTVHVFMVTEEDWEKLQKTE